MSSLKILNIENFFSTSKWNKLSNSLMELNPIMNLLNSNTQNIFSNITSLNLVLNLLNNNLENTAVFFKSISESAESSSKISAAFQGLETKQISGTGAGSNGTGDPDPKDLDPLLLKINDIYTRLSTLIDLSKEKGSVNLAASIISGIAPPLTGVAEDLNLTNELIVNNIMKSNLSNGGKNMKDELLEIGVSKEKIDGVNWEGLTEINWFQAIISKLKEIKIDIDPNSKKIFDGIDLASIIRTVFSNFADSIDLSDVREDVFVKMKKRRDEVDKKTYNNTPSIEVGETYLAPMDFRDFFWKNKETYLPDSFPRDEESLEKLIQDTYENIMKDWGSESNKEKNRKFDAAWKKRIAYNETGSTLISAGVKEGGVENLSYENMKTQNHSTSDMKKKTKGPDPYEVFEKAYGEARKLGGSLNTVLRNLHIGADTFVGQVIDGFGTALTVIETILAAIQAAQAASGLFGILKTGLSFIPGIGPVAAAAVSAVGPKAGGGMVWGGSTYLVGEHGMELFTPNVTGSITSHREILQLAGNVKPQPPVIHTVREPYIVTTSIRGTDLKLSLQRTENRIGRERS